MTREEAKVMAPIMKAYAEGKTIQYLERGKWFDAFGPSFSLPANNYRIKPEPKYKPFKTQEECWNEMLKHQPFGYIKRKENNEITQITGMNTAHYGELHINLSFNPNGFYTAGNLFNIYTFTDGTPFGVKDDI